MKISTGQAEVLAATASSVIITHTKVQAYADYHIIMNNIRTSHVMIVKRSRATIDYDRFDSMR